MSGGSLNWIPGALRSQQLSISASRHLSFSASQLLSISVLVSWESLAEVSKGCKVPRVEKKVFCDISRGRCTALQAPPTFVLLGPNDEKMTQIGRCCRISFRRVLDEVRFSTLLVSLMERLIWHHDQLDPFCVKFLEPENWEGGPMQINKNQWESMEINENQ